MKRLFTTLCAALLCGILGASAQPATGHRTPRPGHFAFGPGTTVAADAALQPLARYLAEYLGSEVRNDRTGDGAVVLTLDPPAGDESPEAYRLEITTEHIRIGGNTYGGVFNGVQALLRLLPPDV